MSKQNYTPMTKEALAEIKAGDVIERMLGFQIPVYLIVQKVEYGKIDAGWVFDRVTGLEIDEDLSSPASYIRRVLNEEQKALAKEGKEVPYE